MDREELHADALVQHDSKVLQPRCHIARLSTSSGVVVVEQACIDSSSIERLVGGGTRARLIEERVIAIEHH